MARIDPARREFIRKLAALGFVVPAVSTFSMSSLMARPAFAGLANQS
jgi:hypothetical protein